MRAKKGPDGWPLSRRRRYNRQAREGGGGTNGGCGASAAASVKPRPRWSLEGAGRSRPLPPVVAATSARAAAAPPAGPTAAASRGRRQAVPGHGLPRVARRGGGGSDGPPSQAHAARGQVSTSAHHARCGRMRGRRGRSAGAAAGAVNPPPHPAPSRPPPVCLRSRCASLTPPSHGDGGCNATPPFINPQGGLGTRGAGSG